MSAAADLKVDAEDAEGVLVAARIDLEGSSSAAEATTPRDGWRPSELKLLPMLATGDAGDMSDASAFLAILAAEIRSVEPMTGERANGDEALLIGVCLRSREPSSASAVTSRPGSAPRVVVTLGAILGMAGVVQSTAEVVGVEVVRGAGGWRTWLMMGLAYLGNRGERGLV
jgi:hypothetical protein